jgi:hypothetical protein
MATHVKMVKTLIGSPQDQAPDESATFSPPSRRPTTPHPLKQTVGRFIYVFVPCIVKQLCNVNQQNAHFSNVLINSSSSSSSSS